MTALKHQLSTVGYDPTGEEVQKRFGYQHVWALVELISRHMAGKPYVFLFEFHDDVVVLNHHSEPDQVEFFQIKTRKGKAWHLSDLWFRKKSELPSILGKLYQHTLDFHGDLRLYFVTNAQMQFVQKAVLEKGFDDLEAKDQAKLKAKLLVELPDLKEESFPLLTFVQSEIGIDSQETFLLGKVQEFLEHELGPENNVKARSLYRTWLSLVLTKNRKKVEKDIELDDLVELKGVSRPYLEAELMKIKEQSARSDFSIALSLLTSIGATPEEIISVRENWREIELRRRDSSDALFSDLMQLVASKVDSLYTDFSVREKIVEEVVVLPEFSQLFSRQFIATLVLWEVCK